MELRRISIIAEIMQRDAIVRCARTSPFSVLANVPMDIQRRVATPQKLTDKVSRKSTISMAMHGPRGVYLRGLGNFLSLSNNKRLTNLHLVVQSANIMGLMRGLILAAIALLPGVFLGLLAYIIMGGNTNSTDPSDFMFLPCYGVPMLFIGAAFVLGMRGDPEVE